MRNPVSMMHPGMGPPYGGRPGMPQGIPSMGGMMPPYMDMGDQSEEEIVYQLDEEGFLMDEQGQYLLDEQG